MKPSLPDLASGDLVVVNWLDSLDRAYALMLDRGVRHLPVADDDGEIVGIVSDRDFFRAMMVDQPDFASGYVARPEFSPMHTVRDFMSWPVTSIDEKRAVADAARLMLDRKISALLVTRGGDEIVGIVTTEDMLRALLNVAESPARRALDGVEAAIARSPVGQIAHALGNAGI